MHVRTLLPVEFHDAACIVSASPSTGLSGPALARLRLWFLLDRPIASADLYRWARGARATQHPVDPHVCLPSQPIYVARPQFIRMTDPVPPALTATLIEGSVVRVPLKLDRFEQRAGGDRALDPHRDIGTGERLAALSRSHAWQRTGLLRAPQARPRSCGTARRNRGRGPSGRFRSSRSQGGSRPPTKLWPRMDRQSHGEIFFSGRSACGCRSRRRNRDRSKILPSFQRYRTGGRLDVSQGTLQVRKSASRRGHSA